MERPSKQNLSELILCALPYFLSPLVICGYMMCYSSELQLHKSKVLKIASQISEYIHVPMI